MSKKEHFKNFAAGATRAVAETGLSAVKGFGMLASAIGKKTGNTKGGDYIQRMATKGISKVDSKIGARANTKMGKAGGFVALTAVPVGRAVSAYTKGVKMAKAAKAVATARHATRVAAGKKSAETYRKSLPRTQDTVEYKSKPIYPVRSKK